MTAVHKNDVTNEHFVVCALYKFVALPNFEALRKPLLEVMEANEVRGTLLLAAEGINGTVSAKRQGIDNLLAWLDTQENLNDIVTKESYDDECPFYRTKVKLKKEIVTMGVEGIDPLQVVGTYVKPKDWNDLISDPDVVLVDTNSKPVGGQFVIAKFVGQSGSTLKKLLIEDGKQYLQAINRDWPDRIKEISNDVQILGRVIQCHRIIDV